MFEVRDILTLVCPCCEQTAERADVRLTGPGAASMTIQPCGCRILGGPGDVQKIAYAMRQVVPHEMAME